MFVIIPAIDIRDRKCVRLVKGDFDRETIFSDDPIAVARRWEDEGAQMLHVVDLDGAHMGRPTNFEVIARIIESVRIPVQVGGGIRTSESARKYIERGASRIIVGTRALLEPAWLYELIESFGEKVVVSLDVNSGIPVISGWKNKAPISLEDVLNILEKAGAKRIIYTDVSRDGTLSGIDIENIKKVASATQIRLIASGGISSKEDISKLRNLERIGVEGAIIGMALYTNALSLKEALEISRGESDAR